MVLASADRWNRLSPAQQQAVVAAVGETEPWASRMTHDSAAASIDIIKKHGMEVIEPDLAPFKRLAAEALAKLDGELWSKGTLEKIQAVR
jgi:TRAP-type C4-dicarboxylate transport system substrate-binding protein